MGQPMKFTALFLASALIIPGIAHAQIVTASPVSGPVGATGQTGGIGQTGPQGNPGVAGVNSFSAPSTFSVAASTAYQSADPTKPAIATVTLSSSATISLAGGTTNTAAVYVGSTSAVATTGGTQVCGYTNSNTGALTIGLNLATVATQPCTFTLPTGYYFAYRTSSGTVTATNAVVAAVG